nr:immunoglobulin heavy chain junction region [Macaca mulatta]MOY21499.1 immunoglobulin heavy chain junction region [Macaca mulatta]MOY23435.1 immunoglobulin heavy chain junction region [Macaca mulatta]MOY23730.1 immunoglobulin heavy chain junction region [Macaca mulatta]MOY24028.1 immunoglobulin heavy chain junction region [Macaca mulatta]
CVREAGSIAWGNNRFDVW